MTGGHGPTEDRDKRVTLTLETSLRAAVRSHSMGSAFANGVRATDTAHVRPELGTPRGGTRRRARYAMALAGPGPGGAGRWWRGQRSRLATEMVQSAAIARCECPASVPAESGATLFATPRRGARFRSGHASGR